MTDEPNKPTPNPAPTSTPTPVISKDTVLIEEKSTEKKQITPTEK